MVLCIIPPNLRLIAANLKELEQEHYLGRTDIWTKWWMDKRTDRRTDGRPYAMTYDINPLVPMAGEDKQMQPKFWKKNLPQKSFKHNSSKIYSGNKHDKGDIAAKFCSYWMSAYHFIMQISTFLFISATDVTLDQGHGKVIQYILLSLYQISKAKDKWFCCEKQNSLRQWRRPRWRKRTENIKSPQTGVT